MELNWNLWEGWGLGVKTKKPSVLGGRLDIFWNHTFDTEHSFFSTVVLVIGDWTVGLETLYLAKQEGMINGDFVFILFELNQGLVHRRKKVSFLWFYNYFLNKHRFVTNNLYIVELHVD